MIENITVKVAEQPGEIGAAKASALAKLLAAVIEQHPEIDEAVKKMEEEKA